MAGLPFFSFAALQNVFNFDIDFFTKYAMIFEHSIFRQYYKCNELIYEVRKVTTYV